eukprot:scaffold19689_cov31-Tisochrysis_lutea.AAC.5
MPQARVTAMRSSYRRSRSAPSCKQRRRSTSTRRSCMLVCHSSPFFSASTAPTWAVRSAAAIVENEGSRTILESSTMNVNGRRASIAFRF